MHGRREGWHTPSAVELSHTDKQPTHGKAVKLAHSEGLPIRSSSKSLPCPMTSLTAISIPPLPGPCTGLPWQIVLRFLSQQLIPIHLSVIINPPPLNLLTLFFVLQPIFFSVPFFLSFFIFIFNHLHRFFSLADGGMCYRSFSLFLFVHK